MAAPNRDTAMELLGIPAEYQDEVVADFVRQWGGIDKDACERVLRNGGEEDEFSRTFALLALAGSGLPTPGAILGPFLNDPNPLLRVASAVSLGYLGDPTSLPHLRKLLAAPPSFAGGKTDEETVLEEMSTGLVWGCIPEILGQMSDPNNLSALRQALSQAQTDPPADPARRNGRIQSLVYAAGRLGGWALLGDVHDSASREDLALLMALGSLHERMVAERTRHVSGGRVPIPSQLQPERTAGELIERALTQHLGFSPTQAHDLTQSKTTNAYLVASRLLSSIEQHKGLFAPPHPAAQGAPS